MDMHHIYLVGHATRDAEEITGKNDKKFSKFSLGINEYNPISKESEVSYYDVLVFGKSSEKVLKEIKKGDKVLVDGKPEVDAYLPKKGKEPKATVTVLADSWKVMK